MNKKRRLIFNLLVGVVVLPVVLYLYYHRVFDQLAGFLVISLCYLCNYLGWREGYNDKNKARSFVEFADEVKQRRDRR